MILNQAKLNEQPIVYVSINYRLGVFGFPSGAEAAEAGAANLGLRDVQKALEWIQENIWAFGGDPDRVTVFGQSAGAILISDLYLQPQMDLFRGAIMHSGAQSTAPIQPTQEFWQGAYDSLVKYAGCGNITAGSNRTNVASSALSSSSLAATGPGNSTFECLKRLPAQALLAAQEKVKAQPQYTLGFIFAPSVDGDLIPDQPHTLLEQGKFARIPYISGSVKDEGTAFIPTQGLNLSNPALLGLALSTLEPSGLPNNITTEVLTKVYPPVLSLGSPFGTGNETFGLGSLATGYKQASAILSDAAFQASRRWFQTQSVSNGFDNVWSYFWNHTALSTKPVLGVPHAADIPYVFGIPLLAAHMVNTTTGNATNTDKPTPAEMGPIAASSKDFEMPSELAMSSALLSFW